MANKKKREQNNTKQKINTSKIVEKKIGKKKTTASNGF